MNVNIYHVIVIQISFNTTRVQWTTMAKGIRTSVIKIEWCQIKKVNISKKKKRKFNIDTSYNICKYCKATCYLMDYRSLRYDP
jgi:hypothetical protein